VLRILASQLSAFRRTDPTNGAKPMAISHAGGPDPQPADQPGEPHEDPDEDFELTEVEEDEAEPDPGEGEAA
jgi:hypothetical protein